MDQRGFGIPASESSQRSDACLGKLRIRVNPSLGEMNYETFCIFSGFETVRQPVNCVRVPLAINLPSDFCARTPEFAALLQRRIRDNEPVVVKQVCHGGFFLRERG